MGRFELPRVRPHLDTLVQLRDSQATRQEGLSRSGRGSLSAPPIGWLRVIAKLDHDHPWAVIQ